LEGFPPEIDELAAEAIEDYDEEAPLLSPIQVIGTIHRTVYDLIIILWIGYITC